MVVIKQAVERIDDPHSSYGQVLISLGAWHSGNEDFCVCNIALFMDSVLYVLRQRLKDGATPQTLAAWETLFRYICDKLQEGFGVSECAHSDV